MNARDNANSAVSVAKPSAGQRAIAEAAIRGVRQNEPMIPPAELATATSRQTGLSRACRPGFPFGQSKRTLAESNALERDLEPDLSTIQCQSRSPTMLGRRGRSVYCGAATGMSSRSSATAAKAEPADRFPKTLLMPPTTLKCLGRSIRRSSSASVDIAEAFPTAPVPRCGR